MAIRHTQQGPGLKFAHKYFGSYEIIKTLRNHRYIIRKIGEHKGPLQTSTAVDYMKPWINDDDDVEDTSESEYKKEDEGERSGRPLGQNSRV